MCFLLAICGASPDKGKAHLECRDLHLSIAISQYREQMDLILFVDIILLEEGRCRGMRGVRPLVRTALEEGLNVSRSKK